MTASISGRLRVDGRPLADADVLLFSEAERRLAASGRTDAEGRFRITGAGAEPFVLLAKVRGPACSLHAVPVSGAAPLDIDVDTAAGFSELSGSADAPGDPPLTVRIDPARVEGVPDWLITFAKQRREGVFEGTYCEVPLADGRFRVRVRHGDYRLRGDRFVDGPVGPDGTAAGTLLVTGVETGAGGADGDPHGGFLIGVYDDTAVRLVVGPGS